MQFSTDFYTISLKNNIQSKVKYGQQYYDFAKGTMIFTAPKQVQSIEVDKTNAFKPMLLMKRLEQDMC